LTAAAISIFRQFIPKKNAAASQVALSLFVKILNQVKSTPPILKTCYVGR